MSINQSDLMQKAVKKPAKKTFHSASVSGGAFVKFLVTIVILAAVGFVVWTYVLPKISSKGSSHGGSTGSITEGNAAAAMSKVMAEAKSTFNGIKDVDSARAALPSIEGITAKVESAKGMASSIPAPVKAQLKKALTDFAPQFMSLRDKVYAIPGVEAVLAPKVDELVSSLEGLAGSI